MAVISLLVVFKLNGLHFFVGEMMLFQFVCHITDEGVSRTADVQIVAMGQTSDVAGDGLVVIVSIESFAKVHFPKAVIVSIKE